MAKPVLEETDVRLAISLAAVDMPQLRALSDSYRGDNVRIVRYFVAAEVKTEDGDEKLLVLSPYYVSVAASERRRIEVATQYPSARIVTHELILNLSDWCDAQRMFEYSQRALAEQRKGIQ
jgi:hypothetical protein